MKKRNIVIIIVTLVIIVLGLSGFIFYYITNPAAFIKCQEHPFTEYPVDMNRISFIAPLGGLNPPDHTYPTDHIYFYSNTTLYPDGFEIYSPSAIIINQMVKVEYNPAYEGLTEDFVINFDVCLKINGCFGHINNLSTFLIDKVGEFGEEFGDTVMKYELAEHNITRYTKNVKIRILAGQLLGRAGLFGAYDFMLDDTQVKSEWVNEDMSEALQHKVCPLNYFIDDLKTNMMAKLGNWEGNPTVPVGYCGKIDFDIPNTAQGIWRREGFDNYELNGLALVYDNFNSSQGAISIGLAGNSTWDGEVYYFNPTTSDLRNRQFDQVTNDGNIYYYYCNPQYDSSGYYKVILIKMTSNQELLLQFIDHGPPTPIDPISLFDIAKIVTYIR
ncbi:MAG: hypothetical protein FK730_13215 [Asgard group archaeon]|nr:hypothetical protein [Asgard group archaeon]